MCGLAASGAIWVAHIPYWNFWDPLLPLLLIQHLADVPGRPKCLHSAIHMADLDKFLGSCPGCLRYLMNQPANGTNQSIHRCLLPILFLFLPLSVTLLFKQRTFKKIKRRQHSWLNDLRPIIWPSKTDKTAYNCFQLCIWYLKNHPITIHCYHNHLLPK